MGGAPAPCKGEALGYERLEWAYGRSNDKLSAAERSVLAYLAFRQNGKTGEGCKASIRRIAEDTSLNRRTVQRVLRTLEGLGLVGTERRFSDQRGCQDTSLYSCLGGSGPTPPGGGATPPGVAAQGRQGSGLVPPKQEDEHEDEHHPPVPPPRGGAAPARTPRRKKAVETYRSPWLDVWNGLARQVPGLKAARVFSKTSEASLVERGSNLGLEGADLERALSEAVLALGEKPREWVTLSWLATGQKGGLEKLLNGDYGSRNGASAASKVETINWSEERRLEEESKALLRQHGIPIKGEERT